MDFLFPGILDRCATENTTVVLEEKEDELIFDGDVDEHCVVTDMDSMNIAEFGENFDSEDEEEDVSSSQHSSYSQEEIDPKRKRVSVDMATKKRAVEFWEGKKDGTLRSLATVQHHFRCVSSRQLLYRWKQHIENFGNRNEKLLKISDSVLDKFCTC